MGKGCSRHDKTRNFVVFQIFVLFPLITWASWTLLWEPDLGKVWERLCERAASATPRSRRKEPGETEHPVSHCGVGAEYPTLGSGQATDKSFGDEASPVGAGRRAEARRGGGGEGPLRQPRASRLGFGVSGSSMATRRLRATRLTPHFQIKMAQAPGLGREPFPPTSCLRACPQEEREDTRGAGTTPLLERPRRASMGMGGGFQRRGWRTTGKPRLDPDPGARETPTPTSCQRGLPPRRWGGGQGVRSVPGWGKKVIRLFLRGEGASREVDRGRVPRPSPAGPGRVGGHRKEELQVSVVRDLAWVFFSPSERWPRSYPRKFRWPSSPSARRGSPRRRSRIWPRTGRCRRSCAPQILSPSLLESRSRWGCRCKACSWWRWTRSLARPNGRARSESLLGREAWRRAAGAVNFLRTPPLKLSGAPGGWAAWGHTEVTGEFGLALEKCPRSAGKRTTRRAAPSLRSETPASGLVCHVSPRPPWRRL